MVGPWRFASIYVLSALGGSLFSAIWNSVHKVVHALMDSSVVYAVISRAEQTLAFQMSVYEARARHTLGNLVQASSPSGGTQANQLATPPNVTSAPAALKNTTPVSSDALWYAFRSTSTGVPVKQPSATPVQSVAPQSASPKSPVLGTNTDALRHITK
ncbi:hypothetical protein AB4Y35_35030 [Paraburkholderia sp. EG286A]|uniref:hypothetical protein n=1 Tax=unclassified Paraburkholderia TaxID=2615204 RepID=UPI0034D347E2